MPDFTRNYETFIAAPVHDVFEYCRDPRHLFAGWPELEVTDVVMSPEGVGTKAHIVGRFLKGMMVEQIEREYTEFVLDERIVTKAHAKVRFAGRNKEVANGPIFTWLFEGRDGGTEVTLSRPRRGPQPVADLHGVCQCGGHGEEAERHAGVRQSRRRDPGTVTGDPSGLLEPGDPRGGPTATGTARRRERPRPAPRPGHGGRSCRPLALPRGPAGTPVATSNDVTATSCGAMRDLRRSRVDLLRRLELVDDDFA